MENNGKVLGVDFTPWTGNLNYEVHPVVGLLYYGNAQLTDRHYIQEVYVWGDGDFVNIGEHFMYVVGRAKVGDYLTTSPVRGAAIVIDNKDLAFAQVTQGMVYCPDDAQPVVGGCYATFLK